MPLAVSTTVLFIIYGTALKAASPVISLYSYISFLYILLAALVLHTSSYLLNAKTHKNFSSVS